MGWSRERVLPMTMFPEVYRVVWSLHIEYGCLAGKGSLALTQDASRRNLELKVACTPEQIAEVGQQLERLICTPMATFHQVDTYVVVPTGRLKLREFRNPQDEQAERGQLIAYQRVTEHGSRWSTYVVAPIAGSAVAAVVQGLTMTHEVLAVVDKVRQVGIVGHTRVHLDTVADLGNFVELETVVDEIDDRLAAQEHQQVIAALGLAGLPSIGGSYSDLMLARAEARQ